MLEKSCFFFWTSAPEAWNLTLGTLIILGHYPGPWNKKKAPKAPGKNGCLEGIWGPVKRPIFRGYVVSFGEERYTTPENERHPSPEDTYFRKVPSREFSSTKSTNFLGSKVGFVFFGVETGSSSQQFLCDKVPGGGNSNIFMFTRILGEMIFTWRA